MLAGQATLLFLLSVILLGIFQVTVKRRAGLMDLPNARSSHQEATPRGAGLVFLGLWLGVLPLFGVEAGLLLGRAQAQLWLALVLMVALGFCEDLYGLPVSLRLGGQLLIVLFALGALGLFGNWPWWALGLTSFLLLWSINLFNFMDGLDGLAGLEAIQVLGFGGAFLMALGAPALAVLAWHLVACLLGFLIWNWPKAKLFMGDAGSYGLGFAIALIALLGKVWFQVPLGIWCILYSAFWFDASLTLLRRLCRGEPWYAPHKSHAYQRLHQSGWSHQRVACGLLLLNSVLALLAWGVSLSWLSFPLGLSLALGLLGILYWAIEQGLPMERRDHV